MTADDVEKLNKALSETIKLTVNGKIDRMNDKLQNYIIADNKWKESVTPSIEVMKKMQDFASVGGWIFKGIILVGSAFGALYTFYKFILQK